MPEAGRVTEVGRMEEVPAGQATRAVRLRTHLGGDTTGGHRHPPTLPTMTGASNPMPNLPMITGVSHPGPELSTTTGASHPRPDLDTMTGAIHPLRHDRSNHLRMVKAGGPERTSTGTDIDGRTSSAGHEDTVHCDGER